MVRTQRPEANGATVTAGGVGRCYAEFGMTGRNDNAGWESAFLCGDEDWACMEAMGRANPEKLPCALDDDDCWADVIALNPPCDTAECWDSFENYFDEIDEMITGAIVMRGGPGGGPEAKAKAKAKAYAEANELAKPKAKAWQRKPKAKPKAMAKAQSGDGSG